MFRNWCPSRFASSFQKNFPRFDSRLISRRAISAGIAIAVSFAVAVSLSQQAAAQQGLTLTRVATGLSSPLYATSAPGDANSLYIVEQGGNIRTLNLTTGSIAATPFLTNAQLTAGNGFSNGGERGLLGLAFDPNYQTNSRYYVNYTDSGGNTRIRSFTSTNGITTDNTGAANILQINQPFSNHNGGWIGFGPDNHLYVATGDGGSGNDPQNNALNRNSLLGKMLRITPDTTTTGSYTIPGSNPFVNDGDPNTRGEIWAYGLRNPFRSSFDRQTGDLWIGDVGQGQREEINFQSVNSAGGENYGWRVREGFIPTGLSNGGLMGLGPNVDPIYDYMRGSGLFQGNSVTGGYVYRGSVTGLQGHYFFGDFVSGRLFSLTFDGTTVTGRTDWTSRGFNFDNGGTSLGNISSFAEDANGNLYIISYGGSVYRISAIPEPAAGLVFGLMGGVLMLRRRKSAS